MKVNHNIQAMITSSILQTNEARYTKSSERMTSGFKINSARDNPAGYAMTNRMSSKLSSMHKANQNASNGINVIQTAEGSLAEVQNMIHRVNELSVKAANATNTSEDRVAIKDEVTQLFKEIERIRSQTQYNTQKLLNGDLDYKGFSDNKAVSVATYNAELPIDKEYKLVFKADGSLDIPQTQQSEGFMSGKFEQKEFTVIQPDGTEKKENRIIFKKDTGAELVLDYDKDAIKTQGGGAVNLEIKGIGGMKIQVGTLANQEVNIAIPELSLKNMELNTVDPDTEEGAKEALEKLEAALSFVSDIRSRLGSYQNQLEATITNLDVTEENLTEAYSTIKDVDMAEEMVEYTRLQVLTQAGVSMLTQANERPEQALQLLG
ncbi:MAG: flagellin [Lachnospiraceae bacterium]|nr:flagellin [Lachnospiraceae bacterium]